MNTMDTLGHGRTNFFTRRAILTVHTSTFSPLDLIINPESFPEICIGDLIDIYPPGRADSKRLVLRVEKLQGQKGSLQISLSKDIASAFRLYSHQEVVIEATDPKNVGLDFVHVYFKNQYLSRSDIWRMQQSLNDNCIYVSRRLNALGNIAKVNKLLINGQTVGCGVVRPFTKFVFRSRSARIYWCFQISTEMYAYANDSELYYEKAIHRFAKEAFDRWQKLEVTHSLTVVFFGRTYYHTRSSNERVKKLINKNRINSITVDEHGGIYEDIFRVVIENECLSDWTSLILRLKRAFLFFPQVANWTCPTSPSLPSCHGKYSAALDELVGIPSSAKNGNFLEALNLTLNVFEKHHMDRDLTRTGQSVVLVTAGTGVFHVDRNLVLLTKRRLVQYGVGIDVISLTTRPFHTVPLLMFTLRTKKKSTEEQHMDSKNKINQRLLYKIPHWLRICFPFDPSPLKEKFAALPAYRMIELLPGIIVDKISSMENESHSNLETNFASLPHALRVLIRKGDSSKVFGSRAREFAEVVMETPYRKMVRGSRIANKRRDDFYRDPSQEWDVLSPIPIPSQLRYMDDVTTGHALEQNLWCDKNPEKYLDPKDQVATTKPVSLKSSLLPHTLHAATAASSSSDSVVLRTREDYNGHDGGLFFSFSNIRSAEAQRSCCGSSLTVGESKHTFEKVKLNVKQFGELSSVSSEKSHSKVSEIRSSILKITSNFCSDGPQINGDHFNEANLTQIDIPGRSLRNLRGSEAKAVSCSQLGPELNTVAGQHYGSTHLNNIAIEYPPNVVRKADNQAVPLGIKKNWASTIQISSPRKMLQTRRLMLSHVSSAVEFSEHHTFDRSTTVFDTSPNTESFLSHSPNQKGNSGPPLSKRGVKCAKHHFPASPSSRSGLAHKKNIRISNIEHGTSSLHPFKKMEQKYQKLVEKYTISRRRWRHIYAKAFDAMRGSGHLADDTFSMDWISLCQPAILPITTDYLPPEHKDSETFQRSFYTINVDTVSSHGLYNLHKRLIIEMVCQRLQQEFQIVVASDGSVETTERGVRYTLCLGHTVHKLSLDAQLNNILIEIFRHKIKDGTEVSTLGYHFSFWEQAIFEVVSHYQEFEPMLPTNWNYLDQVVAGYFAALPTPIKDRRIRFVVIPQGIDTGTCSEVPENEKDDPLSSPGYETHIRDPTLESKNLDLVFFPWLQPKSTKDNRMDDPKVVPKKPRATPADFEHLCITRISKFFDWLQTHVEEGSDPIDVETAKTNTVGVQRGKSSPVLPDMFDSHLFDTKTTKITLSDGSNGRYEWLLLEYDSIYYVERCFHISIRFVVCSGKTVSNFIGSIFRHTRRFGLEIFQVPEYAHPRQPPYLHPFSQPYHIPLPFDKYPRLNLLIQDALLTRFGFILESDVRIEGSQRNRVVNEPIGFVNGISALHIDVFRTHEFGESASLPHVQTPKVSPLRGAGGRQYFHKTGDSFVRVVEDGFIWIPNRMVELRDAWEQASTKYKEFHIFCETCSICFSELMSLVYSCGNSHVLLKQ
jgi:hypothetical protein